MLLVGGFTCEGAPGWRGEHLMRRSFVSASAPVSTLFADQSAKAAPVAVEPDAPRDSGATAHTLVITCEALKTNCQRRSKQ
jgi:hypothetical protein